MNKKLIAFTMTLFTINGSFITPLFSGGLPVFDGVAAVNFLKQIALLKQQYETLKDQLSLAERLYTSTTGSRGFGDAFRNPELRKYLPEDMGSIYDSIKKGGYTGISGSIHDILKEEQLTGSVDEMQQRIEQRTRETAATDKAVGLLAYQGAQKRYTQIESLMNQINSTQDEKGIAELQARIAGEQATIQNEITKLQMISLLQDSEKKLILNQRHELNAKILNSKNTEMPRIK